MKRVVEFACAAIVMILLAPFALFAAAVWLFIAPLALVWNIGMMGWDAGIDDWKLFFWR